MMVLRTQSPDALPAYELKANRIRTTHDTYREIKAHRLTYSMAHGRGYKKKSSPNPSEEKTRNLEDTVI